MDKGIVFIIVEGETDNIALGISLINFYEQLYESGAKIIVYEADILTKDYIDTCNIKKQVTNVIKQYAKRYGLKCADIKQIIHITDTDGVFVDDTAIQEDPELKDIEYKEDAIYASKKTPIIKRNKQKTRNINLLVNCPMMWKTIPYKLYYMSCNLEHVLYNIQNCDKKYKRNKAQQFAREYNNDLEKFKQYIGDSYFSVNDKNYKQSWEFITKDNNSLKRYTNLCLIFNEEQDDIK